MFAIDALAILLIATIIVLAAYGLLVMLAKHGWLGFERPDSALRASAEDLLFQLANCGHSVDWERYRKAGLDTEAVKARLITQAHGDA